MVVRPFEIRLNHPAVMGLNHDGLLMSAMYIGWFMSISLYSCQGNSFSVLPSSWQ